MIIIDTFLLSEPFEKEVLLAKFCMGSSIVTEWIISENAYTFRGEFKGLLANGILSDSRFTQFRDRIKLVSTEVKYPRVNPYDKNGDKTTFLSQYDQRDTVIDHVREKWEGQKDVWLLVSDADECLDGSTSTKRGNILQWTRLGSDLLILDRKRFWFDFDNEWRAQRFTPLVRIPALIKWLGSGNSLGKLRGSMISSWPSAGLSGSIFEYSACFDKKGIYRKYETIGHVGMFREDIDRALECNHRPQFRIKGQQLGPRRDDWLERIQLNERNSPTYVRERFELLRTGNIPDDYIENRKRFYPEFTSTRGLLTRRYFALRENLGDRYRTARNRLLNRVFPSLE